ncbi:MAG: 4Fe-4S binding protein [Eubacteriaceae bacterium]|nr:4Fe-4S binding protein [Eubacteriaceae bacterium]
MKLVSIMAKVDKDKCIGCKTCEKLCPVLAIQIEDKKAIIDEDACRGCANCADRCPVYAITMVKREEPFTVKVDVKQFPKEAIDEICRKAHVNPEQVLCYCVGTRAEEVAAALLSGAKTPEEVSSMTGMRTGCTIECIQPMLRMVEAAGNKLQPIEGGHQWYGKTITAWELSDEVKDKYKSKGFFFDEDKELLDQIVNLKLEEGQNEK